MFKHDVDLMFNSQYNNYHQMPRTNNIVV